MDSPRVSSKESQNTEHNVAEIGKNEGPEGTQEVRNLTDACCDL